uniref:Protein chromatin remodeling 35-like n=1 Tax=Tanacetum cinerariifolium TaxID=118510 RepID=A0A699KYM1_TANCI|nr:protein chromatin remodeling 35-like [Tanacetum cinerariifolium]
MATRGRKKAIAEPTPPARDPRNVKTIKRLQKQIQELEFQQLQQDSPTEETETEEEELCHVYDTDNKEDEDGNEEEVIYADYEEVSVFDDEQYEEEIMSGDSIESIIEFQHPKGSKSIKTYHHEGKMNKSDVACDGVTLYGTDFSVTELSAHPSHQRHMKPHQIEGFNFLMRNLVSKSTGGCILAPALGSGKTFMLISFIQSFMAKYPNARPMIVLPKGILETWKEEFIRASIEKGLRKSSNNKYYEVGENTLAKDDTHKRKELLIKDIREMTSKVLHYYKGDNLDELRGLVDMSVFLNLSPKQKCDIL